MRLVRQMKGPHQNPMHQNMMLRVQGLQTMLGFCISVMSHCSTSHEGHSSSLKGNCCGQVTCRRTGSAGTGPFELVHLPDKLSQGGPHVPAGFYLHCIIGYFATLPLIIFVDSRRISRHSALSQQPCNWFYSHMHAYVCISHSMVRLAIRYAHAA